MTEFEVFWRLGWAHITDFNGFDHMLFLAVLSAAYGLKDWKRLLWLVTAFTVGHCITLILVTLIWPELAIPAIDTIILVTIFLAAVLNLLIFRKTKSMPLVPGYFFAAFFGLIHGLGFSDYLRGLLGSTQDVALPLFAFNVGIETGQVAIVLVLVTLSWGLQRLAGLTAWQWNLAVSSLAALFTLYLIIPAIT